MRKIRTKIILLLIGINLLPIIPFYLVVNKVLEHSLSIGFNKNVEQALEESAVISKDLYSQHKREALNTLNTLVSLDGIESLFVDSRHSKNINLEISKFEDPIRVDVFDEKLNNIFSVKNLSDFEFPELERSQLTEMLSKREIGILKTSYHMPRQIYAYSPVNINKNYVGFIVVTKVLSPEFIESSRHIIEVNQMFKSLDFIKEEIRHGFLMYFMVIFTPVVVISLGLGYYFSKLITSPLIQLSKATKIVGEGNWDYRLEADTKDEIGQLIEAFNKMIETIQEKQQNLEEQYEKRRLLEEDRQRKIKDLEMAELQARALQAENERKNIELEKALELEKAYKALNESHKHLKETQAKLVQSEKMASLGNLAAGVAHEINNPIGAIHSAADVAIRAVDKITKALKDSDSIDALKSDKKFNQALNIIKDNTKLITEASIRVIKIVRSLKTFARLDEAKYQAADIHEGIDSTLMLLQHEIKNRINIERKYGLIPPILCYPDELNQVFMNILANATQAIHGEGEIHIETFINSKDVIIIIEDTGEGIPEENIHKIFDPGFTTKGVGVGTGLGMSISYNIMQKHNGEILVESKVNKGTKFTLILPLLTEHN